MLLAGQGHPGRVGRTFFRWSQGDGLGTKGIRAVRPAFGDEHLPLSVAAIDPVIVDEETDHAKPRASSADPELGESGLELAGGHVDEFQAAHVFDDQRPAAVGQGQIDGSAGESHLRPRGREHLVGRHHDTAIGLHAHGQALVVIDGQGRHCQCQGGKANDQPDAVARRIGHEHTPLRVIVQPLFFEYIVPLVDFFLPSPPLRGRGVGGEGGFPRATNPLTPAPLPRSGGEGRKPNGGSIIDEEILRRGDLVLWGNNMPLPTPPRIGIVTISDRASQGVYEDRGGPAIQACLTEILASPWEAAARVIPDERSQIENTLKQLCDEEGCCLVVTTGGTGPARRDVTPEATVAVCDKILEGFGEQMRAVSLRVVPTAILSRQVAGVRGRSLIVNLPGKPSAIRDCLLAVFPAIPYCIDLIEGPYLTTNEAVVKAFRPKA